jgi:DNA repair ATPase RecN
MQKYPGLRFEKFDLHVHTPASHDFAEKGVTAEQVVQQALDQGLCGIAVTDHSTGDFVDEVKEAANGRPLTVFPGVEICCTGGKSGIHIIALLDTDKGKKHIAGLLAAIGISPDDFGKKDAVTSRAPYDVFNFIASAPYNGIAVLAHCTSAKGALHDIMGKTRQKIFEHPGLLAVETSQADFTDPDKKNRGKRAVDVLDGKDPNYANRRLGVYIASDSREDPTASNHTLAGIGANWTYLKVDAEPSLESLRQCFIDRDVRIRQHFNLKTAVYPQILEVGITGGFFDGEEAAFHQGLNSVLGAKGAGKSLLIEFMRFALNQPTSQKDIRDDYERKLAGRLETYGTVALRLIDETGTEHEIERTYDPSGGNPYREEHHDSIANSFSVLFLSQNEIVKIAEDEKQQIVFIDRFFDFRHFRDRISTLEQDLSELDKQFADGLRAHHLLAEVQKQIKHSKIALKKIDKLLSDPIYDRYKKLEDKDRALTTQREALTGHKNKLLEYLEYLETVAPPKFEEPLSQDPAIKRNHDLITSVVSQSVDAFRKVVDVTEKALNRADTEYKKWTTNFVLEKQKYQKHVRTAGGDRKALEKQRLRLVKEIADLKRREQALSTKANALKSINENRSDKMKELFAVYREYSLERKERCEKFERESNGRLQLRLYESTNIDEFKAQLKSLKRGSYLRDTEIEQVCEAISPHDFILELLRYHVSKDTKKIEDLAARTGIDNDRIQSLCEFLLAQTRYEELLTLQYRAHPEDRPEIRVEVTKGRFEPIRDISVGQKCTAMLIMALSDGTFPIVIDQPEDSLDVRSVWDDMCTKIRKGKENRQFIFTTHNSCLAVASDTDKFTVVESDAYKGRVSLSGALESGPVKEEVIRYLEGGRPTYRAKANKYGSKVEEV